VLVDERPILVDDFFLPGCRLPEHIEFEDDISVVGTDY
jgi:hypothetical protein